MGDSRIRGPRAVTYIQLQNSPSDSGLSTQRLHGSGDNSVKEGSSHTYAPVQDHDGSASETRGRIFPSRDSLLNRLWAWEVLSIAVATVALAAMFITLLLHQDRTLPKWPSMITINALIAVFSAILKACLMMPIAEGLSQLKWLWYEKPRPMKHIAQWDMASRGPWGSLLLIFVLRGRNLAVFGAILTIFAMAVDPFAQQIVHYYSCSVMAHGEVGAISFSNNYTDARWRNGDGDKSIRVGPAQGVVWEQQTCVHVNWAWLSLPAAMVLLTAVFLALTVIQTSFSDRPPWKSSMLATLFNGLDEKTKDAAGPVMSLQEMQVAADTTNMQLKMTQGGFRLVGSS
ncbi:hypothetical protein CGCSCA1_v004541 [Colletotrichum siamense]|nr:hypothetical protein CGCSCA1_v004541 [Colletotrichum siamense]